ncbi:MAG: alternative ribosome rescue aminoacyl-tRNA hydrolase ArfB [Acidobacteriota bacterium]
MPKRPETMRINDTLYIPNSELIFEASRGGGPGGQHVNTSATRVTVGLDVAASPSLDARQKSRIYGAIGGRISKAGVLSVSSHGERSQLMNRRRAEERLAELLRNALEEVAERVPTRTPRGVKRRRLKNKKHRSNVKALRGRPKRDD